jgi:hypothetical protein
MSSYGAIDVETNEYVMPQNAFKGRNYTCADCNQRVIFRKGDVRIPHFSHFTPITKCRFYDGSPGESEIHKHSKLLIQKWLNEKKTLSIGWSCKNTTKFGYCGVYDGYTDDEIKYQNGDSIVIEYRDPNGKYVADVAILNDNKVRYIIEIKHSHATSTLVRPEPWIEIDSGDISSCEIEDDTVYLDNCRINEKRYCSNCRVKQEGWVSNIPVLVKKYGVERGWKQELPCISCGTISYSPEWIQNRPRQVCKMCLGCEPERVRSKLTRNVFSDTIETS